jgi:hypothetical protein
MPPSWIESGDRLRCYDPSVADSLPLDTTADANEFQLRVYQRMGGAARVAAAFRLSAFVRETAVAGIRYRHPEYTDQQALFAWQRLSLGDSLFREAFPERPRLEP